MSNLAHLKPVSPTHHLACAGLTQAEVIAPGPLAVTVALWSGSQPTGEEVEAQLAVAFQYTPTAGDRVLVIGNDEGFYVIGVLAAQRRDSHLSFAGDVEVAATGKLTLRGEQGVELTGPQVQVRAGKLELLARSVTQHYERVHQRVVELLSLQAGRTHTVIDGSSFTRAGSATLLTKEKVSINGKSIHLG